MKKLRTTLGSVIQSLRPLIILKRKIFSEKYLLTTNVIISWGLTSLGDVLEQEYELYKKRLAGKKKDFDFIRTRNMGLGGCTVGVISHFGYKYLDRIFPERKMGLVLTKILIDQLIFSPLSITAFFLTLDLLERRSASEYLEDLKTKAWRLYKAEWLVWPIAQFVNFYWLPYKYRVCYDNFIAFGFDIYTSRIKHEDEDEDEDEDNETFEK